MLFNFPACPNLFHASVDWVNNSIGEHCIIHMFHITDTPIQWKIYKTRRKTPNAKNKIHQNIKEGYPNQRKL